MMFEGYAFYCNIPTRTKATELSPASWSRSSPVMPFTHRDGLDHAATASAASHSSRSPRPGSCSTGSCLLIAE